MMWKKIEAYVKKYHMIEEGDRIVLGLSGGADSVCLFMFLLHMKEQMQLTLFPVHVNHGIRGEEAMRDQQFSEALCEKYGIPLKVYAEDVPGKAKELGLSEEEAGRTVRYDCFRAYLDEIRGTKIAVAHHLDDQAETVLFRMTRGTGITGLVSMRPVRGLVIRPLLGSTKKEILEILTKLDCSYMKDSTNEENRYGRNRIRNQVIPALSQVNPAAARHIAALSEQAAALEDYLGEETDRLMAQQVSTNAAGSLIRLEGLHPVMAGRIIREVMADQAGCSKDFSGTHVDSVYSLKDKTVGAEVDLPYGLVARRTYEGILIGTPAQETAQPVDRAYPIDPAALADGKVTEIVWDAENIYSFHVEMYHGQEIPKNDCIKYFDYDKIKSTVFLRTAAAGDAFVMDESGSKKTVRRDFIDRKIPAERRKRIPVLAQGNSVIWVGTGRVGYDYLVDEHTKRILVGKITGSEKQGD